MAIGSVIGLVVYAGIGVNLFENLTGTAETLNAIPVVLLLALVLAGLADRRRLSPLETGHTGILACVPCSPPGARPAVSVATLSLLLR